MSTLDKVIGTVKHDIEAFNNEVKQARDDLTAMGERCDTLLAALFKAYLAVPDPKFQIYISNVQDSHDDGEPMTPDQLMEKALGKYRRMKDEKEWKTKSPDQERIIALEAQVKRLGSGGNKKSESKTSNSSGSSGKPPNGQRKAKTDANNRRQKPEWMSVAPKQGENHSKTVDGKEYHYCPKHKAWGRHKPADCQGKGVNRTTNNPPSAAQPSASPSNDRQLRMTQAMESIMNEE
jgi:hypothetical protein